MSLKFQFKLATINRTKVTIIYLYFGDLLFIFDTCIYVKTSVNSKIYNLNIIRIRPLHN